jgi:hypothetical protein
MLVLTSNQEKIYTELLQQQLNADSRFQLFTDDEDFKTCKILEKLDLVSISETRMTVFVTLNKLNIRTDLATKFVK